MSAAGGFARRAFARLAFRLVHLTSGALRGLQYFAAGALRPADLQAISRGYWCNPYGDDNSLEGHEPWEVKTYGQIVRARDALLIVGCGTGRDLIPFVQAGHRVVGVDPSGERLATLRGILQERGSAAELVEGFVEDVRLPGPYDVAIFSPFAYSYIPDPSRRIAVLRDLAQRLNSGGRIVLTYRRRTAPWSAHATTLARLGANLTRSGWSPQPYDIISVVDARTVWYEHWFTAEEIEDEARHAGLEAVSNECHGLTAVAVFTVTPT